MRIQERAREPEQKAQRRDAILAEAAALWSSGIAYGDFTMSALAARAHLAKGTLYLYFPAKEDLFLALLERELHAWFSYVDGRLARLRSTATPERCAAIVADSLEGRDQFVRLLVLLESVFEHGIAPDAARAFKLGLDQGLRLLAQRLSDAFDGAMNAGDAYALLLQIRALICGLWVMASPSPAMAGVLASEPALRDLTLNFRASCTRGVRALVRGFLHESEIQ